MKYDPFWMLKEAPRLNLASDDVVDGDQLNPPQLSSRIGGGDLSPHLRWSEVPSEAKSFAVTVFDPDAPTPSGFWHWAVYNIPANISELPTNAGGGMDKLPPGAIALKNDRGVHEYVGAAPPVGTGEHRYFFAVYALNVEKLDLHDHATPAFLSFNALQHTVAWNALVGVFEQKV